MVGRRGRRPVGLALELDPGRLRVGVVAPGHLAGHLAEVDALALDDELPAVHPREIEQSRTSRSSRRASSRIVAAASSPEKTPSSSPSA